MGNESNISVDRIKEKIQIHLDEAKKLQEALDVILLAFEKPDLIETKTTDNKSVIEKLKIDFSKFKSIPASTFKTSIRNIFLEQDRPLTTKEVMLIYNSAYKKDVKYSSFSGQFSVLSTKDNLLRKITLSENPIEVRYFYGLDEWFEGNELKNKYMEKIKAG